MFSGADARLAAHPAERRVELAERVTGVDVVDLRFVRRHRLAFPSRPLRPPHTTTGRDPVANSSGGSVFGADVNLDDPDVRDTGVRTTHDGAIGIERSTAVPRTFPDWYRAEYHQVVALVYVLSGSRWAAEELAQDAFLEAHRRWETVEEGIPF